MTMPIPIEVHCWCPFCLLQPSNRGEEAEAAGRSRGTRDAGAGGGVVGCGDVECWPVRGAAPTPHYLATYAKAQTSLRKDLSLTGLCFSPQGFLQSCQESGRVQGPRERKGMDLRAEQGLRGRDNITTTLLEAGYDSTNPR